MYKRWPCCGLFQSPLGAFADLANPAYRATDADLIAEFRANAADALGPQKTDRAVDKIMNLHELGSASMLMGDLVP